MNAARVIESLTMSGAGIAIVNPSDGVCMNSALQSVLGLPSQSEFRCLTWNELDELPSNHQLKQALLSEDETKIDQGYRFGRQISIGSEKFDMLELHPDAAFDQLRIIVFLEQSESMSGNSLPSISSEKLYRIGHDLKSPVRAIRNLAEWIAEEAGSLNGSSDLNEYLALLRKSVLELNDKIETLMRDALQ